MKTIPSICHLPRRGENGSATLIFIALLAIMVTLMTLNLRVIRHVDAVEKQVEQKQVERLNSKTNAIAGAAFARPEGTP